MATTAINTHSRAITTKYLGPTNTRGSRVVADDGDGNRLTLPWQSAWSEWENHEFAARALCDRLGWSGTLAGGWTKRGMVFVFVPDQ